MNAAAAILSGATSQIRGTLALVLEVPFYTSNPWVGSARYRPISIGQVTDTCPSRSYWWLLAAAVAGGVAGWQYSKSRKKARR